MPVSAIPLSDLRVIDLTVARAGPTCVRQLADWGADVIRIDQPAAVAANAASGHRDGSDFQNLHRNKRSIELDLKTADGHDRCFQSDDYREGQLAFAEKRAPAFRGR